MSEFKIDDFIRSETTGRKGFVLAVEQTDEGTIYLVDFLTDPSPDRTTGEGYVLSTSEPLPMDFTPECETCGDPIDYCQGHGDLG